MAYIVLDTEAAPLFKTDKVEPRNMRVYDLGYVIVENGSIVARRNYAIADTFKREGVMASAYYAKKLPMYYAMMERGELPTISLKDARRIFAADCKEYNVKTIWAWNCRFDYETLNATIDEASNGFVSYFIPFGIKVRDIATLAGETVCATKKYVKWCRATGNVTAKGNPKTTAEAVYRYVTGDVDFQESHTALDDSVVEYVVLRELLKRHAATDRHGKRWGQGWRTPAKVARECVDSE